MKEDAKSTYVSDLMEEKEITFNKNKAMMNFFMKWVLGTVGPALYLIFFNKMLARFVIEEIGINVSVFFALFGAALILWRLWDLLMKYLTIRTLKYTMAEGKLSRQWSTITYHNDTAKLQVINSVDITQSIVGWMLKQYNISVRYGISDIGYTFGIAFLDKETAERLVDEIKPMPKATKTELV